MDHSAAPIFDALVNYRAHGQYRFAPPDTVRAMRMREPAPPSAVMRSTRASSPRRVGRPPILARYPSQAEELMADAVGEGRHMDSEDRLDGDCAIDRR